MNAYETVIAATGEGRRAGQDAGAAMPVPAGPRPNAHAAPVECTCPDYCDLDHGND